MTSCFPTTNFFLIFHGGKRSTIFLANALPIFELNLSLDKYHVCVKFGVNSITLIRVIGVTHIRTHRQTHLRITEALARANKDLKDSCNLLRFAFEKKM